MQQSSLGISNTSQWSGGELFVSWRHHWNSWKHLFDNYFPHQWAFQKSVLFADIGIKKSSTENCWCKHNFMYCSFGLVWFFWSVWGCWNNWFLNEPPRHETVEKINQSPFPQKLLIQNIFQALLIFIASPQASFEMIQKPLSNPNYHPKLGCLGDIVCHIRLFLSIHWSLDSITLNQFWVLLNVILNVICNCYCLPPLLDYIVGKELIGGNWLF